MEVQNPIILHDNARSHTAAVTDLLRSWQWDILEHLPYSPDESACDYDLFEYLRFYRKTKFKFIVDENKPLFTNVFAGG